MIEPTIAERVTSSISAKRAELAVEREFVVRMLERLPEGPVRDRYEQMRAANAEADALLAIELNAAGAVAAEDGAQRASVEATKGNT